VKREYHIGIDDTDSPYGMCTTYVATIIATELVELGCNFIDFPYLVRLNPNIPFKTRGNGAVSLHLECECSVEELEDIVERHLERYAHRHGKTDPTAVIVAGPPADLNEVYRRAVVEFLPPSHVARVLDRMGAVVVGASKGRGLVGAAASVGAFGDERYSYELLLYRPPTRTARERVDEDSIFELDRLLRPLTFANVDYATKRVLATPHGPDPVIAGIRSFNPLLLSSIAPRLAEMYGAERATVFKTNQGTGVHLTEVKRVGQLRPYDSAVVRGVLTTDPRVLAGGHVLFELSDGSGSITCAVYRETGFLARVARLLRRGDRVEVGGAAQPRREGLTLNVEYIRVLESRPLTLATNPLCPICGKRLKSAGRGKGFKCPSCGFRSPLGEKIVFTLPRVLEPGLYLQCPSAYRHLSIVRDALGSKPVPAPPLPQLFLWPLPKGVESTFKRGDQDCAEDG